MSTDTQDHYNLERDSFASVRLNAQHYLWTQICGFHLHPSIPSSVDGAPLKIADLGTGTAIWALDVATTYGYSVDASDIDLGQCPPAELMPKGCTVSKFDMLQEVPSELHNVYDVVHVRLLQGGLQESPVPALKNLMKMLKPGGYIQWEEVNVPSLTVKTTLPGLKRSAMDEVRKYLNEFSFSQWVPHLAEICTEVGLEDARTHKFTVPPGLLIPFIHTQFGAYREVSKVFWDNSTPESKGPLFRKAIAEACQELHTGVVLPHDLEVTVARKAA